VKKIHATILGPHRPAGPRIAGSAESVVTPLLPVKTKPRECEFYFVITEATPTQKQEKKT